MELKTANQVIDELGGTKAVAELTGRSQQQVSSWRAHERLGSSTFLVISAELKKRGHSAPPDLWGIEQTEAAE